MEHRGIQYQVVQTTNPTGFKWTVEFDANRIKTGTCKFKASAISNAVGAIEKTLGHSDEPIKRL